MRRTAQRTFRSGFTLIELMIVVAITGILASVALPEFIWFQARSRQSEAKVNLRSWYQTQVVHFAEKGQYAEKISESNFAPERGNRYAYQFGSGSYQVRSGATVTTPDDATCIAIDTARFKGSPTSYTAATFSPSFTGTGPDPGVPGLSTGTCPNCNIAGEAVANLDSENTGVDTWFISTKGGTGTPCGTKDTRILAGVPFQAKDDTNCN